MKTCLIYGQNGVDLDIALNLVWFYEKLGFLVAITNEVKDVDLLVVLRVVDKPLDLRNAKVSVIHIFDYAGWDYDNFVKSIDSSKTWIFCTSEAKRHRLINSLHFPKDHVFLALVPVDVNRWSKPIKEVQYKLVHIGHYKPVDDDNVKTLFNYAVKSLKVNVWGLGWNDLGLKGAYHGKLGVFNVSSIYSCSLNALGIMYPFQRDTTYSGRFWHAPLNGCRIFSEHGLYSNKIPGVVETDYSIADLESKLHESLDREKLQFDSRAFWVSQEKLTRDVVLTTISKIQERNLKISEFLNYKKLRLKMIAKKLYQYLSLFKFVQIFR